ncbi:MAG: hypothetical protein JNN15_04845 [Blastocatellia bacterium]|nr:hypothetical protein [Blastocatellia bacterium]
MARKVAKRLKILATLVAQTPFHIGGYGTNPDTNLPLAVNGSGNYYIPGTSIAGVLRSWCSQVFETSKVNNLWGFQEENKQGSKKGEDGQASFVIIEDTLIELPENTTIEIRDGVGINRYTGSAADKAKYDRGVLPRDTKFQLSIIVEMQEEVVNFAKVMFGYLLEALKDSQLLFGASKTRGLGRVKLTESSIFEECLSTKNGILALLSNNKGNQLSIGDLKDTDPKISPNLQPKLDIKIFWKPSQPVMVKSGYDAVAVDTIPLVSGIDSKRLALVLPGSSIKGVLRSQAERIVRTVLDIKEDYPEDFLKQIKVPLIGELFGVGNEKAETASIESNQVNVGLAALSIADCYTRQYFQREEWKSIETEKEIKQTSQEKRCFQTAFHVAIDRWTGGASEGALYNVLEPHNTNWEPINLTLDFGRLKEEDRLTGLSLLLFVLRDLMRARLPFGFATNRGMGEIEVCFIEFTPQNFQGVLKDRSISLETMKNHFSLPDKTREVLNDAWREWINKQTSKAGVA